MIDYFINLSVLIFAILFVGSLAYSVLSFAPWVPSRGRDMARIFQLADLRPGQIFYDLGCGDGRLVFNAAKKCGAKAIGLEISLPLYLLCVLKRLFSASGGAEFKFKNLFSENLSSADVVYFFGMPKTIKEKLALKLARELKPGAKIISYAFKLEGRTPAVVSKPSDKDLPVYLYVV